MASNHIVICRNLSFFHFSNKLIAAINCFDVNLLMAAFHLFRFPPGNINCKLLLHISIRWSSTKSLSSFAWELVQLLPFTYSSDRTLTNKLFAQAFNCISSNLNSRDSLPADGKVPGAIGGKFRVYSTHFNFHYHLDISQHPQVDLVSRLNSSVQFWREFSGLCLRFDWLAVRLFEVDLLIDASASLFDEAVVFSGNLLPQYFKHITLSLSNPQNSTSIHHLKANATENWFSRAASVNKDSKEQ